MTEFLRMFGMCAVVYVCLRTVVGRGQSADRQRRQKRKPLIKVAPFGQMNKRKQKRNEQKRKKNHERNYFNETKLEG